MEKEIKILINMCLNEKDSFTPTELSTFLNLKFVEGIYPYLKKLISKNYIEKSPKKGEYNLNSNNLKVQDIIFITKIIGKKAEILFTHHAQKVLEKFSAEPIIKKTKLPQNSLKLIKNIASNTKIIHPYNNDYFISCWEETTQRLLHFFDISLKFDEEEFKHAIKKFYSNMPNTNIPSNNESQKELKLKNIQAFLENKDFILDKIKNIDFPFLIITKKLTENKLKEFNNPFDITTKINEWKLRYIYNTDRIEGNPLTMQEVKTIITLGGASPELDKKAVLETINSRTALDNIFNTSNELTIDFIKKMHLAIQYGIDKDAGQYKKLENCIVGSNNILIDTTTPAEFTEQRMNNLIKWYDENKDKLNPLVLAAVFHNQFVFIHPFNDGNGRLARLIFNFILIKNGFFPIIFYSDEKETYYNKLRTTKSGYFHTFIIYCFELYRSQLDEF